MRDTLVTTLDHHLSDARRKMTRYQARALAAAERRSEHASLRSAFSAWRADVSAVLVLRRKLLRLMATCRARLLNSAMRGWLDAVALRHYHEHVAAAGLRSVQAARQAQVLGCWRATAHRERWTRRTASRASARRRRGAMASAFRGWASVSADQRRTAQLAAWSHTRTQLVAESVAFGKWRSAVVASRVKHNFAVRAHARASASATLEAWAGMAAAHKDLVLRLRQQGMRRTRRLKAGAVRQRAGGGGRGCFSSGWGPMCPSRHRQRSRNDSS